MRWFRVWLLRRRRDRLSAHVDWVRDMVWSGQIALEKAEQELRAAQAELWCVESPRASLGPRRPEDGFLYRGGDL